MSLFDTADLAIALQARVAEKDLERGLSVENPKTFFSSSSTPFNVEASVRDVTLADPGDYRPTAFDEKPSVLSNVLDGKHVPLNDSKERRKRERVSKKRRLQKWFGLPEQANLAPETVNEIKALEFRGLLYREKGKRVHSARVDVPSHFHMVTEVPVGLANRRIGESTRLISKDKKNDRSVLSELLRLQRSQHL